MDQANSNPARLTVVEAGRFWREVELHARGAGAFVATAAVSPIPLVSVLVAVVWYAGARKRRYDDLANDPPREDFTVFGPPRPVPFRFAAVRDEGIERDFRLWAEPTRLATAEIAAFVRAMERMQGAEAAEEPHWAARQRVEADRFAGWAAEHLHVGAARALPFAQALEEQGMRVSGRSLTESTQTLEDAVPEQAMANLYRWGVPVGVLREKLVRPRGVGDLEMGMVVESLREAAAQDTEVANLIKSL